VLPVLLATLLLLPPSFCFLSLQMEHMANVRKLLDHQWDFESLQSAPRYGKLNVMRFLFVQCFELREQKSIILACCIIPVRYEEACTVLKYKGFTQKEWTHTIIMPRGSCARELSVAVTSFATPFLTPFATPSNKQMMCTVDTYDTLP